MEKRVLFAALLSAIFLAFYSRALTKSLGGFPRYRQAVAAPQEAQAPAGHVGAPLIEPLEQEEVITISSPAMSVEIGKASAAVRRVVLAKFQNGAKTGPLVFETGAPLLGVQAKGEQISWRVGHLEGAQVEMDGESSGNKYHILYHVDSDKQLLDIVIDHSNELNIISTWKSFNGATDRSNPLELISIFDQSHKHKKIFGPVKEPKLVPRGTTLFTLSERYFCQVVRPGGGITEGRAVPSEHGVLATLFQAPVKEQGKTELSVYFGPKDYFYLQRAGLEEAIPIGMFGQIGLILLLALGWLGALFHNYGVAIIVLASTVTSLTAPFTILGMKSMKKMQELKPLVDKIMAEHKSDPTKANKKIFELYREHRVSPMSGCLPILLQMPIFIALFQAISHYIELRGESFLWIKDLSMPDRLAQFSISVPIIGNEINLLPVLMAFAMAAQTKLSQAGTPQDPNNPTAKMFSGPLMAILFGVMFYHIQSGLVLYWLTNTLTSLTWYKLAK